MTTTRYGVWNWAEARFVSDVGRSVDAHTALATMTGQGSEIVALDEAGLSIEMACDLHPDRRWGSCETCIEAT